MANTARSKAGIGKLLANSLAALFAVVPVGSAQAAESAVSSSSASTPDDSVEAPAPAVTLPAMVITAAKADDTSPGASGIADADLASQRASTSDSARLLQDIPGVSLYGAGGISSLPAIHGMADDRLRIQVDGMDAASACPNHMNSALSYINPTKVGSVKVFAGITPVSVGGDSIGGTVQMNSAPPEFAKAGEGLLTRGQAGAFYRSNGNAQGYNLGVALAGEKMRLSYDESNAQSGNYSAGRAFKPAGRGGIISGNWLDGNVVGSSAYRASRNRDIGFALRSEGHLLQLNVSEQQVGFEGFPNQRMDMTANKNTLVNLRYTGQYEWGELEARIFDQDTRHKMDMGPDRFDYGTGMPMLSKAKTRGALLKASIDLTDQDTLRVGSEYQTYDLDDWWPPVGQPGGSMCCNAFQNVSNGKRDRVGVFSEWEARWTPEWLTLLGIRTDTVKSNAGDVAGYNTSGGWAADAASFNALDRQRTDHHVDLSALLRYEPDETASFEAGYARKTRSPSLYERYPWSTNAMAALMNNFVGDGNGYIGNPDLKPEVANTLSVSGDWHDAGKAEWGLKATGYLTYVENFIDARRCDFGKCDVNKVTETNNVTKTDGFVLLQYANQSARLYGVDMSGHRLVGQSDDFGSFTVKGLLNYVRGENRESGDNLYHIMPLNAKFALVHGLGAWTNTAEVQLVAAKTQVSHVRNEVPTDGYSLLNLRSSYDWKQVRLDVGIENVFNRFYSLPLGGAYVGQGMSMSTSTIPWGITVPGRGRSIEAALNVRF